MLSRLLRQFLFTLVHLVVNILVAVQNVYLGLFNNKIHLSVDKVTNEDILKLIECSPKMQKKLKHLVVLANTSHHSMCDLARIVIWSLVLGVPYISFYDVTGELQSNDEALFFEIQKSKKGIPGCIKFSNKPNLNGYTNGSQANTIVINIFNTSDGREKIAKCIQGIAKNSLVDKVPLNEFTVQEFNKALSNVYPCIPDPEVVLYTGRLCCTHGLLPWQIRLSEFIPLSLFHSIHVDDYINAIYKYNKCDQRFGK
ncbi:dehydrodolichyl diphosphate synthase complex subunit Nus1 [Aricia agestis]|uniref:dehydrodolichyl diphosphate synthase complex subunit Nus1 n=1 Tax=Aricia agestis TaxID=91739 RepID=UPI001C20BD86|nr:dehydrodolichyl diphosphate synthase complex subunit Nus1 [Aricia agestis]